MRWKERRRSTNVEDRRGRSAPRKAVMGGGVGTVVIIIAFVLLGGDPEVLMETMGTAGSPASQQEQQQPGGASFSPEQEQLADFVSVVLADTEDVWNALFNAGGMRYREPRLVLFSDQVQSACGIAGAAVGPFYCPGDSKVYIDLGFYGQLRDKLGAPGDFAQAYVIAHEIGHHVQNLLGISGQVHEARQRLGKEEYNRLSVRLELQADYLAGVWAHHAQRTRQILEQGDLEEAMNAAQAIGDDKLQKQARGYVVPDSFTHGTSAQRMRWFMKGFESGDMNGGNTFEVSESAL